VTETTHRRWGGHGVEGLKVLDASVIPYVTNGNIYAPVMMVAKKAAGLIVGNPAAGARDRAVPRAPAQRLRTGQSQLSPRH
jgi:choline dehydrogenase